jgi:ABC-type transporter Mla MlaB component
LHHAQVSDHRVKLATGLYPSLSLPWDFAKEIFGQEIIDRGFMSSNLSATAPLTLPVSLTIKSILAVYELISSAVEKNVTTVLDIVEGAQVDLSFVQLIVAARDHAQAKGGEVLLARPAAGEFQDALKRGGFLDDMTQEAAQFWLHQEKI